MESYDDMMMGVGETNVVMDVVCYELHCEDGIGGGCCLKCEIIVIYIVSLYMIIDVGEWKRWMRVREEAKLP